MFEAAIAFVFIARQPAPLFECCDRTAHLGLVHGGMRAHFRCRHWTTGAAEGCQRSPFRASELVARLVLCGKAQGDEFGRAVQPVGQEGIELEAVGGHRCFLDSYKIDSYDCN
ncbi:hypothetical protein D9M72_580330 [compost metagenome]